MIKVGDIVRLRDVNELGFTADDFGMDDDEYFDFCDLDGSLFTVTDVVIHNRYFDIKSDITGRPFFAIGSVHLENMNV